MYIYIYILFRFRNTSVLDRYQIIQDELDIFRTYEEHFCKLLKQVEYYLFSLPSYDGEERIAEPYSSSEDEDFEEFRQVVAKPDEEEKWMAPFLFRVMLSHLKFMIKDTMYLLISRVSSELTKMTASSAKALVDDSLGRIVILVLALVFKR